MAASPTLKLKRIRCGEPNAHQQLAKLRQQLAAQAEVVTPAQRKTTQAVFGEPLPPLRAVERICAEVREQGLPAVLRFTEQFDKVKLTPAALRVTPEELAAAHAGTDPAFIETIRRVRIDLLSFQTGLLHTDAVLTMSGSHELQVRYRPMKRVGIHVPGGAAAYPSTLLMTVVPAQAAGVPEIAVVMPPTPKGGYNADMLAVCHELGIREVYRVGGAQAIAALAYGIDGVPAVNMIVGPGNTFVALAKKTVYGTVAIDCIAGPSEIVVIADESAQPDFVALDLIAQAEHNPGVGVLIAWQESVIEEALEALVRRLRDLDRGEEARDCLERYGAAILARDKTEAAELAESLAPEHLHIQTRDPEAIADLIDSAGAIFLGSYTPVAVGDYAAGPSHVLPTGGTARWSSGLTSNDFLRRTSVLSFTRAGLRDIADDVIALARKEGLTAHAASVFVRTGEGNHAARPPKKADKKK